MIDKTHMPSHAKVYRSVTWSDSSLLPCRKSECYTADVRRKKGKPVGCAECPNPMMFAYTIFAISIKHRQV